MSKIIKSLLKSIVSADSAPKLISIQMKKNLSDLAAKFGVNSVSINIYIDGGELLTRVYYVRDGKTAFSEMEFFSACFGVEKNEVEIAYKLFDGIRTAIEKTIFIIKAIVEQDNRKFFIYISDEKVVLMLKAVNSEQETERFDFAERLAEIMSKNATAFNDEAAALLDSGRESADTES